MRRKKIIGVIGSKNIGTDPFELKSWSGISAHFFRECDKAGILETAIGVDASWYVKAPLILRNFSINRKVWRRKLYLDTTYYEALTNKIMEKLQRFNSKQDILQIGAIYNIARRIGGRNRCFSYHDGNLAQLARSPSMPAGVPKAAVKRAMEYEKDVYKGLDKIFTMSEYLRESFIDDFGVPAEKVFCIGAGINMESLPKIIEKDYERKEILFIGISFLRKGGHQLLEAFERVTKHYKKARLHVVGPEKLHIPEELRKSVVFHGFLKKNNDKDRALLQELFRRSSLFVMPSLYEPFGIAVIEAMANQLPCIVTNGWALPEMVRPGYNGHLVEIGNVGELSDIIIELLGNPDALVRMGGNARRTVEGQYTWEIVVERLLACV